MSAVDPGAAFPGAKEKAMTVSAKREDAGAAPLARLLAWVVFALMVAAAGYAAWIALANFNRIGV
jgi:hypothetical protein